MIEADVVVSALAPTGASSVCLFLVIFSYFLEQLFLQGFTRVFATWKPILELAKHLNEYWHFLPLGRL